MSDMFSLGKWDITMQPVRLLVPEHISIETFREFVCILELQFNIKFTEHRLKTPNLLTYTMSERSKLEVAITDHNVKLRLLKNSCEFNIQQLLDLFLTSFGTWEIYRIKKIGDVKI